MRIQGLTPINFLVTRVDDGLFVVGRIPTGKLVGPGNHHALTHAV